MKHQQNAETQKHHNIKTYQFDVDVAQEYGVEEAIILRYLQFWIKGNRENGKHFYDGRTWYYGSVRAFAELWPFSTPKHINRKLNRLIKAGVLVKGNYNPSGYDRTLWYAFKDEKTWFQSRDAIIQKRQMERTKVGNRFAKSVQPIPNQNTIKNTVRNQRQKRVGKSLPEKESFGLRRAKDKGITDDLVLAGDKVIAEGRNRLAETIARLFPPVTGWEKTTFQHILAFLVHGCQTGRFSIEIFDQAVLWAQEAKADGIKPKKLFVHIVKNKTGFAAKQKNQQRAELKKSCDGSGK